MADTPKDTLHQIRLKIWRAREKTESLDDVAHAHAEAGIYTIKSDVDRKMRTLIRIETVKPYPDIYPLLIGEIAHQLRSALDHLIFALANAPSPRKEDFVKFPLCNTGKRFQQAKRGCMPGVPRGVIKLVESVQPYHRRKWPETRFLGQLQTIDNWDKHRSFATAAASVEASSIEVKITGNTSIVRQETFRGVVKPNKIIARIEPGPSETGAKIEAKPTLGLIPVFDDRMPKDIRRQGVRGILSGAGSFIEREIIPRFERFF